VAKQVASNPTNIRLRRLLHSAENQSAVRAKKNWESSGHRIVAHEKHVVLLITREKRVDGQQEFCIHQLS
jgi:hypothetical protein